MGLPNRPLCAVSVLSEPESQSIAAAAAALKAAAQACFHRRALLLAGERRWCTAAAQAALVGADAARVLWLSDAAPEGAGALAAARAHQLLGRELEALVFDAWSGFDPDAFGAASGALRGGGLLLLLCPPLASWPEYPDPENARVAVAPWRAEQVSGRFLQRLVRVLRADPALLRVEQGRPPAPPPGYAHAPPPPFADPECRTPDQRRAVAAIEKVVSGQRRRPVVLTADRGRGKSAALGIAAAHLLQQGLERIVVTGPRLEAAAAVFEHAHRLLPGAAASRAAVHAGGGARIDFIAPDELAQSPREADLVLVDEAAAVPAPLLERLLALYPRIAFATTVHGYEGTGRGFAVRFNQVLDARSRGWRTLRLETPVRWAPGDPLEQLVFRALLLDAEAAPSAAAAPVRAPQCSVERLERATLLGDETALAELFGLLVLAHYRTRPYDLRHLLDGPNLTPWVMRRGGHVLATALVAEEGGFDAAAAQAICAGRRRPHGHLLPESLGAHLGLREAPRQRCARIMRIAVHPEAQGRGLGTRLLQAVVAQARRDGLDYIGTSFGISAELLRFWGRLGFQPVRLGVTRGAASGAHSALLLQPLSAAGAALHTLARGRFLANLPHLLADPLRALEPALAAPLLTGVTAPPAGVGAASEPQDRLDLEAFAYGTRLYEACMAPIWHLALSGLGEAARRTRLGPVERDALIVRVLQRRGWQESAAALGLPGRAQVSAVLRGAVARLLEDEPG